VLTDVLSILVLHHVPGLDSFPLRMGGTAATTLAGPAMARRYPLGDIKILWALAAGRCGFPGCHEICIAEETSRSGAAAIGDIAHIVAHSPTGPRGDENFPREAIDTYSNWILLCPKHHRMVDAQPATYEASALRRWKRHHEAWVARRLSAAAPHIAPKPPSVTLTLYRVARAGHDPWQAVTPAAGHAFGRWDDPLGAYGVRYAADSPAAAVAETLAHFGPPDPELLDSMSRFFGDPVTAESLGIHPRAVLAEFSRNRVIARARVTGAFADLEDSAVGRDIDERVDVALGPRDVETSPLGDYRRSQQASRVLFETAQFDGIVFRARAVSGHRLYALFPSARVSADGVMPIGDHLPPE
jgi:hypothetical protein